MAQLFKGHIVDDNDYPMPQPAGSATLGHAAGAQPSVSPQQVAAAAGDLERIVGMVNSLRPAVEGVTEALRSGAQQQGYSEGIARAQAEVHTTVMEAMAALTSAQQERHALALQHEGALADLALRIARKVIGAHLEADPTIVARIVQDTLGELEPTVALEVHVHPEDLTTVEAARSELDRLVSGSGSVQIIADNSVDRGGCLLVSPVGDVDARISTKLAVLETAFAAQRKELSAQQGSGA
jgi:flagellar biosynthesis/type III secretory pathway protein FliH